MKLQLRGREQVSLLFFVERGVFMKASELIARINDLADETESPNNVLGYINDAIAKINIELNSGFPSLDLANDTSPAFPEQWQHALIIPFSVGRIKQKDSSQFEYTDAYAQFLVDLMELKTKYVVPDRYKLLSPGIELTLPDSSKYEVEWGDTLQSVADANNTTVSTLKTDNEDVIEYFTENNTSNILENVPFGYAGW